MVINKGILLLACPIFTAVLVAIAFIGYSSFKILPNLQDFIQKGHIEQQMKSKSRDLLFLDSSIEAGYQESFKQVFALRAYYQEILNKKVKYKASSSQPLFVKLEDLKDPSFKTSNSDLFDKINSNTLNSNLQVTGWSDKYSSLNFNDILDQISTTQYTDIKQDLMQFQVLMKGILSTYYLQQDKTITSSYDPIFTVGVTFPSLDFTIFLPLPTDAMLKASGQVSTVSPSECKMTSTGEYNFNNVCDNEQPTIFTIKDMYSFYSGSGAISQGFDVSSHIDAIIYAQFDLTSLSTALDSSLINNESGNLFIVLADSALSLLAYNESKSGNKGSGSNLLDKIFSSSSSLTKDKDKSSFKDKYQDARSQIESWKTSNNKQKYLQTPVNFSFKNNGETQYCIISPIEVYPGAVGTLGSVEITYSYIIFYVGYIVSETELLNGFDVANKRMQYIEWIQFIVVGIFSLLSLCIVVRYSYMISYSYQNPIITMSRLMQQIDPEHVDQEEQYEQYQNYFTSDEIKSLFEAMVTLLKNFKYSNQRFHDEDALTLLELSRAKQFYTKFGNQNGMGICCNNIGNIHLKNNRHLEAISEYQEATLMATMEFNLAIEEIKKEKINKLKYEKPQPADLNQLLRPIPNGIRSKGGTKRNNMTSTGLTKFPLSPLKQPIIPSHLISSQDSSTKTNNLNFPIKKRDAYIQGEDQIMPPSGIQNDEDIVDGDLDNSQTARINMEEQQQQQYQYQQENMNQCSTSEKKLFDLYLKQDLSKMRLINRKYQLGVALFEYSTIQKDDLYHEAIRVFEKCLNLSAYEGDTRTNLIRKILINSKTSYCHLRLGEHDKAEAHIKDAREILEKLAYLKIENTAEDNNASLFSNIFSCIPLEILKSKIDLQSAILELSKFNFQKAAYLFIQILQEGEIYDSQVRKYALLCLKTILEKFNLGASGLIKKLMKFNLKTIELIMLIDYSRDMTFQQINNSHKRCKSIFDSISGHDKIGFAQFNELVHENFPLQEKEMYNDLLEKKIRSIPMNIGGRSNLFKALVEVTTNLFDRKWQINSTEESSDQYQNELTGHFSKYQDDSFREDSFDDVNRGDRVRFICLFTEGNSKISNQDFQTIKELMHRKQVHLLALEISNQNANKLQLRDFVSQLSELSVFFNQGDIRIEDYLNNQREPKMKRQLIAEYF